MNRDGLISTLAGARWFDLTQPLSIFTPPWPGEMPLQVHFFKRLTGSFGGGQGANGQLIEWSNNTGTHLVGPRAFHSGARAIADIPLEDLCGEGVVADADVPQVRQHVVLDGDRLLTRLPRFGLRVRRRVDQARDHARSDDWNDRRAPVAVARVQPCFRCQLQEQLGVLLQQTNTFRIVFEQAK